MGPEAFVASALLSGLGAGASALASKPGIPNIPAPPKPALTPAPKPRSKSSMQDSFLTGVAGTVPTANAGSAKTLLGQ